MAIEELYQRVFDETIEFINDKDSKILFVCLPAEELTNRQSEQDRYWNEFYNAITRALRLSLKKNIPLENLSYPGDWYKKEDCFLLIPNEGDNEEYYFLYGREENQLTFTWQPKIGRNNCAYSKDQKRKIIEKSKAIYPLTQIPAQIHNGYKKCCKEIELLNSYTNSQSNYSSGVIVCSPTPKQPKYNGEYIKPIVELANSENNIPKSDIAIVIGDKATKRVQQLINRFLNNHIQKLIVFASQPTHILLNQNPKISTITFKDIHNYCSPKDNVRYYNPEFIEIKFEWLEVILKSLNEILKNNGETVGNDGKKHIYNFVRKIFTDIDFCKGSLNNFKEYFPNFLDSILGYQAEDVISSLETWCEELVYDSDTNPKKEYYSKQKAETYIDNRHSVSRQVSDLRGYNNLIVIDAPIHIKDNWTDNRISAIMRYHNFARIHALYYKNIESDLMRYSKANLEQDCLFNIDNNDSSISNDSIETFSIEDYFLNDKLNNFTSNIYVSNRHYPTIFNDDTQDYISGDILVVSENETYERLPLSEINNQSGLTIIYYSQNNTENDTFRKLFMKHHALPKGKTIDDYSELWHNALQKLINDFNNDEIDRFCREIGISIQVLNNHLERRSLFLKKNTEMNKVLNKLIDVGYITKEEVRYIEAARKFTNGKSIAFGGKLKDALLEYKLNPNGEHAFLEGLIEGTELSIDKICEEFLCTKTIK